MKRLTLMLACFFISMGLAIAQNKPVSGTVTDESGEPVIGASVVVKGNATVGTSTDLDGKFSLTVPASAKTLIVQFLGMENEEVAVADHVSVSLKTSTKGLNEVVVVGYGTQSQRSLASSVSVVKSESMKDVPSVSFDQMLQGRATGVSITTPSAGVGQPSIVNIRGVNSINSGTQPLYVIDGLPMQSGDLAALGNANALADINPQDIESISILKDAAATALYGSRAANGVIIITTKKGSQGAVKINYDVNVGFSNPTKYYKVLNAQQYVDFKNQAVLNRWGSYPAAAKSSGWASGWDGSTPPFALGKDANGNIIDTNWANEIYQTGAIQNHTLSISGATNKSDFYLSVNHTGQDGIVIGDEYQRTGVRANASAKPMKYLKVGINSNYSNGHTHYADASRNGENYSSSGFPRLAIILPPNIPARNEDGTAYFESGTGIGKGPNQANSSYPNPLQGYDEGNANDTWVDRIIASAYAEITPITGLTLKSLYGVDHSVIEDKIYWNPYLGDGYNSSGYASGYSSKLTEWTWTNTIAYSAKFASKHQLDVILGMESSRNNYGYWGLEAEGLTDYNFKGIEAPYTTYSGAGGLNEKTMISYFGNVNYNYNDKYMLSVNYRRDGYSPLGVTERWGNFYGAAVAYRISEEDFFKNNIVNDLKLKASTGNVGNTNIGYYPAKSYYSSGYYGGNGAYFMTHIGDPGLKWESSQSSNIGFESTIINRINFNVDWYYKKSKDLILDVAQASSTGLYDSKLTTNAGTLMNTGVEIALSADVIKTRDFTWNSAFNISFNKNKVLKLVENIVHPDASAMDFNTITVEGKSMGQLYLYPTGGIDPATGRRIFYGSQGEKTYMDYAQGDWFLDDGTAFQGDFAQVICGNTLPTYYGGWTNAFQYKSFDLNLFFQFSGGNHIYNGTKATASDMRFWNNTTDVLTKAWSENNKDNAIFAKPIYGDNYSNGSAMPISDLVEKGDYIRLKNISLGYTFNTKNWGKNFELNISSLRLYAQVQNLFTITSYTGLDPEVLSNVLAPNVSGGIDKNTLPQARTYTVGLNVTF